MHVMERSAPFGKTLYKNNSSMSDECAAISNEEKDENEKWSAKNAVMRKK
jgi:hypothetical protein